MIAAGPPSADLQSAFLDSNVLVRLFQFWDACRHIEIPLDDVSEWKELKTGLQSAGASIDALNREDGGFVREGLTSFQSLSEAVHSYQYFSSRVCWSETHHVLLEQRGLEQLILQGVPHSLRVKRPQVLYRVALEQDDYLQLEQDLQDFRDALHLDYGLDVIDVEDASAGFPVTPDSIWTTAKAVWSRVLMEVIDAYVYAAAIRIEADVFITSDTSLRDALRRLRQPEGDWVRAAASLKEVLGLDLDALLPQPIKPTDPLPDQH